MKGSFSGQSQSQLIDTRDLLATLSAGISTNVAVGGRAEFYFGSKLIATDSEIKKGDYSVDSLLGNDGTKLSEYFPKSDFLSVKLYNANNQMVDTTVRPFVMVNTKNEINLAKVNYLELFGKITPASLTFAYQQPDGEIFKIQVATSNIPNNTSKIKLLLGSNYLADGYLVEGKSNTVEFNFDLQMRDAFGMNGFKVAYMDSNGNTLQTTGDLRDVWSKSSYGSTYVGPSAITDIQVQAVGGNVVYQTFNASNTGLVASAKISGSDYAGGRAELHFNFDPKAIAVDDQIASSDTSVNFSLNSANLNSIINKDSKFSVWVYNAKGELNGVHTQYTVKQDFKAPDAPRKLFISDGANGTKNVELQITAMQSTGGKAILSIDNQLLAQDNYISSSDGFLDFNLTKANADKLAVAIGQGKAEVTLFDAAGNSVLKNLQSLTIFNDSASNLMVDITPPTAKEISVKPRYVPTSTNPFSRELVFKFSESINKLTQLSFINSNNMELNKDVFKADSSLLSWNAAGNELTLRSGASDNFFYAEKITVIGVQDFAGNISDITFNLSQ